MGLPIAALEDWDFLNGELHGHDAEQLARAGVTQPSS